MRFLLKNSWIYHLLFWAVALVFLSLFFGRFNQSVYYTFLFALYQLPIIISTTYAINYWLIPKYLFRKRYARFIYFLVGLILVSVWANALITIIALVNTYKFDIEGMPYASFDFFFLTAGLYLIILIGVVIHLARESFKQQEEKYKLQEKQTETSLKLKESKLKLLQGQLHPHMLFNSLNTIYGFALQKTEKAPDLIINLSNLLDYMLYHCDVERIPLEKEIDFLSNYVEIEKHKLSTDADIQIQWPANTGDYLIAPLILLPFCENCFKHARHTPEGSPKIEIVAAIDNDMLLFTTKNSFDPDKEKKSKGGLGIQNVEERLQLIYKDNYLLEVKQKNNLYFVKLHVTMDKITHK